MSGRALRLVIFDVDGTLIDSQAQIFAAMTHAFAACGRPGPQLPEVLAIVGLSLPQAVARLAPELGAAEVDAVVAAYKQGFFAQRSQGVAPLYPGARSALEALRSRPEILLGVATGKSRHGLEHELDGHGLTGWFATRQVADDHPSKPHPAMIEAALAETGVACGQAVMVGDTTYDIEMARAAGIVALGVGWGYHSAKALTAAGAHLVLEDFAGLGRALDGLWGQG